jgi:hypothetical protein
VILVPVQVETEIAGSVAIHMAGERKVGWGSLGEAVSFGDGNAAEVRWAVLSDLGHSGSLEGVRRVEHYKEKVREVLEVHSSLA